MTLVGPDYPLYVTADGGLILGPLPPEYPEDNEYSETPEDESELDEEKPEVVDNCMLTKGYALIGAGCPEQDQWAPFADGGIAGPDVRDYGEESSGPPSEVPEGFPEDVKYPGKLPSLCF